MKKRYVVSYKKIIKQFTILIKKKQIYSAMKQVISLKLNDIKLIKKL